MCKFLLLAFYPLLSQSLLFSFMFPALTLHGKTREGPDLYPFSTFFFKGCLSAAHHETFLQVKSPLKIPQSLSAAVTADMRWGGRKKMLYLGRDHNQTWDPKFIEHKGQNKIRLEKLGGKEKCQWEKKVVNNRAKNKTKNNPLFLFLLSQ